MVLSGAYVYPLDSSVPCLAARRCDGSTAHPDGPLDHPLVSPCGPVWSSSAEPGGFRAAVANCQLCRPRSSRRLPPCCRSPRSLELVLLAAGILTAPVAIALGLLLAVFAGAIALALAQGRSFDCGCSGTATPSRIGWRHVALDLVLAAGAVLVAGHGPVALSVWPGPFRVDPWKVPAAASRRR